MRFDATCTSKYQCAAGLCLGPGFEKQCSDGKAGSSCSFNSDCLETGRCEKYRCALGLVDLGGFCNENYGVAKLPYNSAIAATRTVIAVVEIPSVSAPCLVENVPMGSRVSHVARTSIVRVADVNHCKDGLAKTKLSVNSKCNEHSDWNSTLCAGGWFEKRCSERKI